MFAASLIGGSLIFGLFNSPPFNEYEIFRLSAYIDVYELQPIRENGHVRRHAETARESPPHAAKATRLSG